MATRVMVRSTLDIIVLYGKTSVCNIVCGIYCSMPSSIYSHIHPSLCRSHGPSTSHFRLRHWRTEKLHGVWLVHTLHLLFRPHTHQPIPVNALLYDIHLPNSNTSPAWMYDVRCADVCVNGALVFVWGTCGDVGARSYVWEKERSSRVHFHRPKLC